MMIENLDQRLHRWLDESQPLSFLWYVWNWLHWAVHELAYLTSVSKEKSMIKKFTDFFLCEDRGKRYARIFALVAGCAPLVLVIWTYYQR